MTASTDLPSGEIRQVKPPGSSAGAAAARAGAAFAAVLQLSCAEITFLYHGSGLSKSHSEWPLASGGVVPPQATVTTPTLVSTLQLTAQFCWSLDALSVTTLMDFPSGAITQPAPAGGASHAAATAATAASTRRFFIESPRAAIMPRLRIARKAIGSAVGIYAS